MKLSQSCDFDQLYFRRLENSVNEVAKVALIPMIEAMNLGYDFQPSKLETLLVFQQNIKVSNGQLGYW